MKDIKGFCKLFDITIPNYEWFDYYVNQLSKLKRYSNIGNMIALYEDAEKKYDDLHSYRIEVSNNIIDYISETNAYNDFNLDNLLSDLPIDKSIFYEENLKYLSIDINSANWLSMKRYDAPYRNELCNSYGELLDKFVAPEIFKHSKSLRQFIFGNLNPKKQIKVQRVIIEELLKSISYLFMPGVRLLYTRNDEIIIATNNNNAIKRIISVIDLNNFKYKIFTVKRYDEFRIDSIYDINENLLYHDMIGVDGTQYYQHIKKYVTNEPIDIKDLYFKHKGKMCLWLEEGVNVNLNN